ncbi:MAG: threonine--tRNA ligase [Thermoproteota archaeon]|nr:MAG: threonine--tRNA ligase [Candidatus Korarchaeota archaeon]
MKLLIVHADYIRYKPLEKAIEKAEEAEAEEKRIDEALVVFTTVERGDKPEVAEHAAREVSAVSDRVDCRRVVVYPWVHLSPNPAPPSVALEVLEAFRGKLREGGFEVYSSPFGWYKSFEIRCKGHPLSETYRDIKAPRVAKTVEEEAESKLLVLTPSGEELPADPAKVAELDSELAELIKIELGGERASAKPFHTEAMRRLELVDYEPAADVGHFRFYPKGTLLKRLLEDLALDIAHSLGAMEIETPLFYREDVEEIREQAEKFREKDYEIDLDGRRLIVRFAGDFGLFEMLKTTTLTYRSLPARFYEISPSFRYEQRGECVGLRRLRSFTMPDIHCFTASLEGGVKEFIMLFKRYTDLLRALQIDFAVAFRVVEEFYSRLKEPLLEMLKYTGKPALIELLPKRKHYWILKHEFQFIDPEGGNAQLSTVQLDIEDSERYGIYYIDEKGEKKGTIIVHSSMGSIERFIYALLETAAKQMKQGEKPKLPLWLSPTQVRILPVAADEKLIEYSLEVCRKLSDSRIRADVDDRDMSLARKVRAAEREWIPYMVFVGAKEIEEGVLAVRERGGGDKRMSIKELIEEVSSKCRGLPWRPLNLPVRLSMRPVFVGGL